MVCYAIFSFLVVTFFLALASICDKDGNPIEPFIKAPPLEPLDAIPENPFHPFHDRLKFEWADYHFSQLQSSQAEIGQGLDLWLAEMLHSGRDNLPWKTAKDL